MVNGQGRVIGITMRAISTSGGMGELTEAYSAIDFALLTEYVNRGTKTTTTQAENNSALDSTFISVIVSTTSFSEAERILDELSRKHGIPLGILLSDDYQSLNPGYWVVFAGPFTTAAQAQNACWTDLDMKTASKCYGRRLSQDPADRGLVFAPARH